MLIQAIQAIINALNALGGMQGPLDPMPPPPPTFGCAIEIEDEVSLGETSFLAEGLTIKDFVDRVGFPSPRVISARERDNQLCANPGIRLRISVPPRLPLEFVDLPAAGTKASELMFTARDNTKAGGCRPAKFAELPPSGPPVICIAEGVATWIYDEQSVAPGPDMWPKLIGQERTTTVSLTVVLPSQELLAMLLGLLNA